MPVTFMNSFLYSSVFLRGKTHFFFIVTLIFHIRNVIPRIIEFSPGTEFSHVRSQTCYVPPKLQKE